MSAFEDILKELGTHLGLTLRPDANQSCRLQFSNNLLVQIDLDATGERLLIGSELGKLPPGGFRDQILKQALRVNGLSEIPRGTLAYSEKHATLILFDYLPLAHLNGDKFFKFLLLFLEHARIWFDCIRRGEVPELEEESPSTKARSS